MATGKPKISTFLQRWAEAIRLPNMPPPSLSRFGKPPGYEARPEPLPEAHPLCDWTRGSRPKRLTVRAGALRRLDADG